MNIEHGDKLFEFRSKQDWINKAQRIWRFHEVRAEHTVCVDQLGRICGWGKHFADAERDNAYPIEVFRLRQDMTPANAKLPGGLGFVVVGHNARVQAAAEGGRACNDLLGNEG